MKLRRFRPSPATVIACVALAAGGFFSYGTWAVTG
jgi:hypothetical protein